MPEYHRLIRQSILPNYKEADIGEFFNYCLREAKNKPDYVYEKVGDMAVKKPIDEADLSLGWLVLPTLFKYVCFWKNGSF